MRISTIIHGSGTDFEERKRVLARKEMDLAYKKHAKYAGANKNPMLTALENLLSGKTDKELHVADQAARQETDQRVLIEPSSGEEKLALPEVIQEIKQLTATERDVIWHEQASPTDEPNDPTQVLEQLRQAALTPAQPSAQDLRVAASAATQIQVAGGEVQTEAIEDGSDVEPYANEDVSFNVPERFQTTGKRDPEAPTLFGKDLEQLLFKRTFNKAMEKYMSHVAMVKNGYRSYNEPQFSRSA